MRRIPFAARPQCRLLVRMPDRNTGRNRAEDTKIELLEVSALRLHSRELWRSLAVFERVVAVLRRERLPTLPARSGCRLRYNVELLLSRPYAGL
jgi:hypothetical protein